MLIIKYYNKNTYFYIIIIKYKNIILLIIKVKQIEKRIIINKKFWRTRVFLLYPHAWVFRILERKQVPTCPYCPETD